MGNTFTPKSKYAPFKISEYEQIQPKQQTTRLMNFRILRHIKNFTEMEEYKLQFNSETQMQDYYKAYEWRLTQQYIVSTNYFVQSNKKQFCSTYYNVHLYTERIPIKLSRIKDIPFPDNLYVLDAALNGFKILYPKTQYFDIQQHMICINNQGKVKVWINDNLSKIYPEAYYSQHDGTQAAMVKRVIQLVNQNTDHQLQPISIKEYFQKNIDNPNFQDAILLLKQYSKEYGVVIPKEFKSIMKVLNESDDSESSQKSQFRIQKNISEVYEAQPKFINKIPKLEEIQKINETKLNIEKVAKKQDNYPNTLNSKFKIFPKYQPIPPLFNNNRKIYNSLLPNSPKKYTDHRIPNVTFHYQKIPHVVNRNYFPTTKINNFEQPRIHIFHEPQIPLVQHIYYPNIIIKNNQSIDNHKISSNQNHSISNNQNTSRTNETIPILPLNKQKYNKCTKNTINNKTKETNFSERIKFSNIEKQNPTSKSLQKSINRIIRIQAIKSENQDQENIQFYNSDLSNTNKKLVLIQNLNHIDSQTNLLQEHKKVDIIAERRNRKQQIIRSFRQILQQREKQMSTNRLSSDRQYSIHYHTNSGQQQFIDSQIAKDLLSMNF